MSEQYEIPSSWDRVELGKIAKIEWGNTSITKKSYIEAGYIAFSAAGPDGFLPRAEWFGKGVVLSAIGAQCGKCFFASGEWATIKNTIVIQADDDLIDNKYLYYYLNDQRKWDISGSGQPFITLKTARANIVPIAPVHEQKRIVDRIEQLFSDLDEGEALLKTVQKQLATYHQSVLKAAVTGELIGTKGNKWKEYNVGQLLTDIRYGTAKKCAFDPTKTPVLRIPNVAGGKIDLTDLKHTDFTEAELKKLRLEAGDILIVRSNGSVSLVGLSAIVTDNAAGFAYAGYLIRLRLKKDIILPEFLNLYLHSPIIRNKIELHARSTSGVHNVNSDEIKAITLNVPSIKDQELIVDKVEEAFSQIAALEEWCAAGLKRSNTLRQSILKSAFSGELVAQDPADEPASELLARIKSGNKQVVKSKQKLKEATSRGGGKLRSDKTEVA